MTCLLWSRVPVSPRRMKGLTYLMTSITGWRTPGFSFWIWHSQARGWLSQARGAHLRGFQWARSWPLNYNLRYFNIRWTPRPSAVPASRSSNFSSCALWRSFCTSTSMRIWADSYGGPQVDLPVVSCGSVRNEFECAWWSPGHNHKENVIPLYV